MDERTAQSRREFLRICTMSGAGLLLAVYTPVGGLQAGAEEGSATFVPDVFIRIDSGGEATITIPRSEMGQGVFTSLAMILAEELDLDWERVTIENTYADSRFGDQVTGGSTSTRKCWEPLRIAGATARAMLVGAAAARWFVKPTECSTKDGVVYNTVNGKQLSYGDLVDEASRLPVPEHVKPKEASEFRLIGQRMHRRDTPGKINGTAKYGIDQTMPGMLYATVCHCPTFGGKVKKYDATVARALHGVRDVLSIESGIAVVAESTWLAFKGKNALSIEWDPGANAAVSTESIRAAMAQKMGGTGEVLTVVGSPQEPGNGEVKVEAVYETPYLAHATLEPMNCLASWKDGKVELWAATQDPQSARAAVAKALGVREEDVRVNVTFMGGGFGRRVQPDFAVEAATISRRTGTPVKLTWTREEDMRHDFYRPPSLHRLTGTVDSNGKPLTLTHHVITSSIEKQQSGKPLEPAKYDFKGAALERAYRIPYMQLTGTIVDSPLPIGYWRSVYRSQNPFALESFVDEMAFAARKDPYEFRRDMLPEDSRLRNVLTLAAQRADWYGRREKGKGKGIACYSAYESYCAHVVEVSLGPTGKMKVVRYVCAVDCGLVVNPDTVEAQMQSSIAFALSAALKGRITVRKGAVEERNFNDYPILTFDEMPEVEVLIVRNTLPVGGIGEMGMGACPPALCNALFAATGKRVRTLPINSLHL
jgi:isoquinoline 1-oxidoreductase subunit beta